MICSSFLILAFVVLVVVCMWLSADGGIDNLWSYHRGEKVIEPFDADFKARPGYEYNYPYVSQTDLGAWNKPYMLQYTKPDAPYATQYYKVPKSGGISDIQTSETELMFDPNVSYDRMTNS